jgi:hypothetical protein
VGISSTRTDIGGVGGRHWTRRSGSRGPFSGRRTLLANGFRGSTQRRSATAGGSEAAGSTRADRAHAPRRTEPGGSVQAGSAPSGGLRPDGTGCTELRAYATRRRSAAMARARASRSGGGPTGAEPHESDQSGSKRSCGYRGPDNNDRQLGGWTQQPEQHLHTLHHLGCRSRDYVGQRPNRRERPGADRIRRHVRRLQRLWPTVAEQYLVS